MQNRLDTRTLELWTERLVAAPSRSTREDLLCQAATGLDGVHAAQVWRALTIGGELRLTPTTLVGTHEALPSSAQVQTLISRELPATGLSRVRLIGATLEAEAPVLALACDAVSEGALDGLEALLTLLTLLEQDSQETALDSIRSLLRDFEGEGEEPL